jgi:hypothetical protein
MSLRLFHPPNSLKLGLMLPIHLILDLEVTSLKNGFCNQDSACISVFPIWATCSAHSKLLSDFPILTVAIRSPIMMTEMVLETSVSYRNLTWLLARGDYWLKSPQKLKIICHCRLCSPEVLLLKVVVGQADCGSTARVIFRFLYLFSPFVRYKVVCTCCCLLALYYDFVPQTGDKT